MDNLEIFDKDGKALHITDVMRSFLKENLTIELITGSETDYYTEHKTIEVKVYLGNDEVCSASDSLS
tara:strand:- start:1054 stop:1254 length:201 start_codon:yes stop_codon:yes gene_type:complete